MSSVAAGLLAVVLGLSLAACGDDAALESLQGTAWVLTDGVAVPSNASVAMPTAAFTSDEVSGSGGCNRYGATYSVEGDAIEIGPVASTNIACPAPASEIEAEFFGALQEVAVWSIEDGELVLTDADDERRLRFEAAPTS